MDPGLADSALAEKKRDLMERYRETLISRLTPEDLREFQSFIKGQYDPATGWNARCRKNFETKLRQYFSEDVIKREIAGIEAVLRWLTPEDLAA